MLSALFKPKAVAVIGASNKRLSIGYRIVQNLMDYGYKGPVFPVHPKDPFTINFKTYKTILEVPDEIDVAHIVIPGKYVPMAMEDCGKKGVKFVIINSAGFKEVGGPGAELEEQVVAIAKEHGVRIVGPNCQGVICSDPAVRAYCNFTFTYPTPGNVAIIAQSGGVGEVVNQRFSELGIGVHMYASNGNACDVSIPEVIRYWGTVDEVKVIVVHIESLSNPAEFLEVATEVAAKKPILGMKTGRTAEGAKAVASHTGGLMKTDISTELIFEKAGVVTFRDEEELVQAAYAFSTQTPPIGNRVGIITNTGGPAIIGTDELIDAGLEIPPLSEKSESFLKEKLYAAASVNNPIDVLATANAGHFRGAMDALIDDEGIDSVFMTVVTPFFVDNEAVAREIAAVNQEGKKPVVVNLMTDKRQWTGPTNILKEGGVPTYSLPETAARALVAMTEYTRLKSREPGSVKKYNDVNADAAVKIFEEAAAAKREFLTQEEAYRLLESYKIPVVPYSVAASADEAAVAADKLGYSVTVKVDSVEVIHKSDAGGLALDVRDKKHLSSEMARMSDSFGKFKPKWIVQKFMPGATEVIVGANLVPNLAHAVVFGLGGIFVEILKDVCFKLTPVSGREAKEMVSSIKGYPVLTGARGRKAVSLDALYEIIQRTSQMLTDNPQIKELDLNPILAFEDAAYTADVRIRV
jgi:acetyltransferase